MLYTNAHRKRDILRALRELFPSTIPDDVVVAFEAAAREWLNESSRTDPQVRISGSAFAQLIEAAEDRAFGDPNGLD